MNNLIKFRKKAYCKLKDWEIIFFDLDYLESKLKLLNQKDVFLFFWNRAVNSFNITDMWEYKTKNTIEWIISNLPGDLREIVNDRKKYLKTMVWKNITYEEIQRIVKKHENANQNTSK